MKCDPYKVYVSKVCDPPPIPDSSTCWIYLFKYEKEYVLKFGHVTDIASKNEHKDFKHAFDQYKFYGYNFVVENFEYKRYLIAHDLRDGQYFERRCKEFCAEYGGHEDPDGCFKFDDVKDLKKAENMLLRVLVISGM